MSRATELAQQRGSYSRAWLEFVRAYPKHPTHLHCFFEGQDDPKYYNPRIRSIVFDSSFSAQMQYGCQGKENVIKAFNLVANDKRYTTAWVAFFIDRDFDDLADLPNDRRVFITPCYAIENLYVNTALVKQVLQDEFGLSEMDGDFQATLQLFEQRLNEFNDATEALNAWIYLHRKRRSGIQLNNLRDDKLFHIKLIGITKKYTVADLAAKFPSTPQIPASELSIQITHFRTAERTQTFRGKYLLTFLRRFLDALVEDRQQKDGKRTHFTARGKVKLRLSDNILSELTQYADSPATLRDFLLHLRLVRVG